MRAGFHRLPARTGVRALVGFLLLGGLGLGLVFGAAAFGLGSSGALFTRWVGAAGAWGPLAAIVGFTGLAFLGVPQFVLVAATVVAFGPWAGFGYSFVGNLVSCVAGFFAGRWFGAALLRDHAGAGVRDFTAMIGRNGFWASAIVRLVPSAPFVVVNMAAGATPMRLVSFIGGTALGSLPKLALTTFAGAQVTSGGGWRRVASLAVVAAVWIGSALWARAWLRRRAGARDPHAPPA